MSSHRTEGLLGTGAVVGGAGGDGASGDLEGSVETTLLPGAGVKSHCVSLDDRLTSLNAES